jgi:hypothetical protein
LVRRCLSVSLQALPHGMHKSAVHPQHHRDHGTRHALTHSPGRELRASPKISSTGWGSRCASASGASADGPLQISSHVRRRHYLQMFHLRLSKLGHLHAGLRGTVGWHCTRCKVDRCMSCLPKRLFESVFSWYIYIKHYKVVLFR